MGRELARIYYPAITRIHLLWAERKEVIEIIGEGMTRWRMRLSGRRRRGVMEPTASMPACLTFAPALLPLSLTPRLSPAGGCADGSPANGAQRGARWTSRGDKHRPVSPGKTGESAASHGEHSSQAGTRARREDWPVGTRPSNFRINDIKRAMKAIHAAGINARIEVDAIRKTISIIPGESPKETSQVEPTPLEQWRAKRSGQG